ncbi:MAG: hypothetical protein CMO73_01125 [Verrucomicrobiales bacterium]|nr:hypothetical protein [Verrucomicrobiales bacterium]
MDDGSGGQGLLIIAIIVITFINWLSQTLKQKAAKKNGEIVDKSYEQLKKANEEAQYGPDQEMSESPSAEGPAQPVDIRELLAAMTGAEAPEQPRPVPVITQEQQVPEPELEVIDPYYLEPEPEPEPEPALGAFEAYDVTPDHIEPIGSVRKKIKTHPIALKLRSEGGAREAIILSEILGKPKALRDQ